MTDNYTSKDIEILGDLAAIRMRPGMYIGSTNEPHQILVEALDNAIDEVQGGYSEKAIVSIDTSKNMYSVRDYGRGIPIGKSVYKDPISGDSHEIETLQILYQKTHSGGKFGDNQAYKISRGMHGVGLKCINALSTHTKAITIRDGKSVELLMSKGSIKSLEYKDTTEPNGVYVEFIPDDTIFESPIIPLDKIIDVTSIPKAFGLNIELIKDGNPVELPYNTIFDLLPKNKDEHELLSHEFKVESPSGEYIMVAMKYTSDTNTIYRGYTNMIYNPSGGSHLRFFENCYKQAWMKYLDNDFKIQDVLIGFRALVGLFMDNDKMAFSSQTKERLTTSKSYFEQFRIDMIQKIQDYFDNHESERNGLIKRFKEYRASQNKLLANKELSSMIYINNDKKSKNGSIRRMSVVPKLRECTSKSRKGTELIICEGDSACGTLIQARDTKLHAILPIRGKILNVSKRASYVQCMKNEEVKSIVNSAGTGIGPDCDHTKSRYDRYLIFTDADADGLNIASLLVSIFVNLLPDLVSAGMVYVVVPPLYSWTEKKKRYYSNKLEDVTNLSTMTRYKGLGEMDPEDMRESCLDPNNETLIQVEFPNNIDDFNDTMVSSSKRYNILESMGLIVTKESI